MEIVVSGKGKVSYKNDEVFPPSRYQFGDYFPDMTVLFVEREINEVE